VMNILKEVLDKDLRSLHLDKEDALVPSEWRRLITRLIMMTVND